jgi:hypothetical protein
MVLPGPWFRGPFWRVFPWDAAAAPGEPFTPEYVLPPGVQTGGRFDLGDVSTLYLALDDPAHALAEVLQDLRGRRELRPGHLRRRARGAPGVHHPLAVVRVRVRASLFALLPDLGDPVSLTRLGIRPDDLSSRDRATTQAISRSLHDEHGLPGFRWWSAFRGEWHVCVLFMDRVDAEDLRYEVPDVLDLAHPVVRAAAKELRLRITRRAARPLLPTSAAPPA